MQIYYKVNKYFLKLKISSSLRHTLVSLVMQAGGMWWTRDIGIVDRKQWKVVGYRMFSRDKNCAAEEDLQSETNCRCVVSSHCRKLPPRAKRKKTKK